MLVTGWGCAESYWFKPDPERAAVRYALSSFIGPGLIVCAACLGQVPVRSPSNVKVELSMAGDKTAYKIGEPILRG